MVFNTIEAHERAGMTRTTSRFHRSFLTLVAAGICVALASGQPAAAAEPAFERWLESLWPQAQAMGISRKTFDSATRNVEPDLTLPDLDIPGRPGRPPPGQAEFVQTPPEPAATQLCVPAVHSSTSVQPVPVVRPSPL